MSLPSDPLRKFASFGKKEGQTSSSSPSPKPKPGSTLDQKDSYEGTTKERTQISQPPTTIDMSKESVQTTCTTLDDGTKIVKYETPQQIGRLVKDAKKEVGGEKPRFYKNGWVIGKGLAKICPDGSSITYYPEEVAHLVEELLET